MTKQQLIDHQEKLCQLYYDEEDTTKAEELGKQLAVTEMALLYGAYEGAENEPQKSIEEFFADA